MSLKIKKLYILFLTGAGVLGQGGVGPGGTGSEFYERQTDSYINQRIYMLNFILNR